MRKRTDVQAARFELQSLVGQYGLNQASGFVSVFDVGFANQYTRSRTVDAGGARTDRSSLNGYSADVVIPIYDFGTTAVRGAKETYLAAANRLAERAVNARSEVREAYQRYRGQYDITRHYQTSVLPLRRTILDQSLLQYSGMLLDVTTLIVDARARIVSNIQAIEAQRDFWIAATDLKAATVGGGFSGGGFGGEPAGGRGATSLAVATPERLRAATATPELHSNGAGAMTTNLSRRRPHRCGRPRPRRDSSIISGRVQAAGLPEAPIDDRGHDAAAALPDERARTTSQS